MTVTQLPARLFRWLLVSGLMALAALGLAGRRDLPMLNAYLVALAGVALVAVFLVDPEMARERLRRGQKGIDPVRLGLIRVAVLVHFVVALLDIGRFHWSDSVPRILQVATFLVLAGAVSWVLWAVSVNRFFVPVIRIQSERGHHVVSSGPYSFVRHPGYAGTVIATPASAAALGSWWALVPALAASLLFVRRTADEDRFLREHLEGYARYAEQVPYRLLPGVW